jgi:hypothetical protein
MMQSGIFLLQYRTEMTDARMPMAALVLRMPMPTYGSHKAPLPIQPKIYAIMAKYTANSYENEIPLRFRYVWSFIQY